MRNDAFPVARLGRLLGKSVNTLYREVRHGRYGAPFRRYGRLHVYIAGIERAEKRKFSKAELIAAQSKLAPTQAPRPLNIQFKPAPSKTVYTREEVLALIEHNLALRDLQWLKLQHQQMTQQMPDGRAIIPFDIPERENPDNGGYPHE